MKCVKGLGFLWVAVLAALALSACDDSSSAGGEGGSGGNRGGIPDTVETFMELSDFDCGKSQKCVATYLTEYHDMAVCDGDNGWVIGTLIEKMDCDFSSSSAKATDKDSEPAEGSSSSVEKGLPDSDAKSSSSAKETKTSSDSKSSSSVKSGDSSSSSSAGKVNCSALLEGETGWNWDVSKECRFNPDIDYGSMTDERDGKVYRTVTIGDQVWMAENLNYADSVKTPSLKRRNWCYNNVAANCDVTGRLYTWAAATGSPMANLTMVAATCASGVQQSTIPATRTACAWTTSTRKRRIRATAIRATGTLSVASRTPTKSPKVLL